MIYKKMNHGKKFHTLAASCCIAAALFTAMPAASLAAGNCINKVVYVRGQKHTVGDFNDDGKINMVDYALLNNYVNNRTMGLALLGPMFPKHYDTNGDRIIDQKDVDTLYIYLQTQSR